MLPDFLCVGAAKSGSTTVHEVLGQHPRIFLPAEKELHFFDDDENYSRGTEWYAEFFASAQPGQIVGEVTPAYMSYESAPARIRATLSADVKLIFSFREPVARAYSEFLHNRRRGFLDGNFEEVLEWEFDRPHLSRWERRRFSFISRGFYATQIARFDEFFSREQMFFILMEKDLGQNADATFARLLRFIGAEAAELDFSVRRNVAYEPRSMLAQKLLFRQNPLRSGARRLIRSPRLRKSLRRRFIGYNKRSREPERLDVSVARDLQRRFFDDEIRRLEILLDRNLDIWRKDRVEAARG